MSKHLLHFVILIALLVGCQDTGFEPKGVDSKTSDAASILPGDARVIAMLDVKNAFANLDIPGFAQQKVGAAMERFTELTGIIPSEDVDDVYVAVSGSEDSGYGSMVVYASFDSARIVSFIETEGGSGITRSSYNETDTYCSDKNTDDADKEMCVAMVDGELILASSSIDALHGMLDRRAGSGNGAMQNPDLAALLDHTGGQNGAWLIAHHIDEFPVNDGDIDENISRSIGLLKDLVVLSEYSSNSVDVTFKAFPKDTATLPDLASIIEGAVSAARLAVKDEENAAELRNMLDGVEVTRLDNFVAVRAAVPKDVLSRAD